MSFVNIEVLTLSITTLALYLAVVLMGHIRPLFIYFWSFSIKQYIFTTKWCQKCPFSTWCCDSNSRPLEHKSSTRYGHYTRALVIHVVFSKTFSFRNVNKVSAKLSTLDLNQLQKLLNLNFVYFQALVTG